MILRRIARALTLGSALVFGICANAQAAQPVAIGASLTIQASDRDKTAAALIAKVESMGGYFSVLNDDAVALKVPAERSRELIEFVKASWKPVEESFRGEDVGASLDELRASLKAKQELYAQLEKLLAAADATGILEVEAAGARLIGEIETLKGRLRAMQHRLDFAAVVVNFRLLKRERPRDDDTVPFPWLTAIGLNALLREFER